MLKLVKRINEFQSEPFSTKAPTIVFLGDSVTQGVFELEGQAPDIHYWYDYNAVYHNQLKEIFKLLYPICPINIINSGINGNSSEDALARLERDVISYSPDLVVVSLGLNDVARGEEAISFYESNLDKMFSALTEKGFEVIFMTQNLMCTEVDDNLLPEDYKAFARSCTILQNNGTYDKYVQTAKELCARYKIPVADCYSDWKQMNNAGVDTDVLLCNRINHPRREMHKLFAFRLIETILYAE